MLSEDWKELVTLKPKIFTDRPHNLVKINIEWDCKINNEDSYLEIESDKFFHDKKLIYCLAYLYFYDSLTSEFLTNAVKDYLGKLKLIPSFDFFLCSYKEIKYYDDCGNCYEVTFKDIHKRWLQMSEQDILDEINSILTNVNKKSESHENILTMVPEHPTNDAYVYIKWECGDGRKTLSTRDYGVQMIYCLAYCLKYKEHVLFTDNVYEYLDGFSLIYYDGDDGWTGCPYTHCRYVDMVYYDKNGKAFNVTFEKILKKWCYMTREEIEKEIDNAFKD